MAHNNLPLVIMSDSDDEDGDNEQRAQGGDAPPEGQRRRDRLERIALFDFLRLVAGGRDPPMGHRTNEALVQALKSSQTIESESLEKAMLACPRDLFIPPPYRNEALVDRPVRVESAGFNISAPHVQAASLQALGIEPGQRVLDVGCGCGVVTAYAAYLAGAGGDVVGVDIRDAALRLATANLQRLRERNLEFTEVAAPIRLEQHNVFIPLQRHRGQYDAIHVGGAMPETRVAALLQLLRPRGGRIVAPVANDLRIITKFPDGSVRHRVLSQVSFSELEVPRDVEVVQALQEERAEAARRVDVPASTFATDLAHLAAPGANLAALAAAAAAESAGAGPPEPPPGPPAVAVFGPASPKRGPNGARNRPRSHTSLVDAHLAPATVAPAHRESRVAEAAAAAAGAADGAEGTVANGALSAAESSAARPPRAPYWTGGWDRLLAMEAGRREAADSAGGGGGGGEAASMEVSGDMGAGGVMDVGKGAEEEVEQPVAAEAPAGPVDIPAEAEQRPQVPTSSLAAAMITAAGGDATGPSSPYPYLTGVAGGALALGPPDCQLEGPGWRLPAHKAVLQARCELLRAHMGSGMRDSDAASYAVPEAVERVEALEAFLHYVYMDCLPPGGVDSEVMPQLLHAGIYFGCRRLVRLCESLLARELVAASQIARGKTPPKAEDASGSAVTLGTAGVWSRRASGAAADAVGGGAGGCAGTAPDGGAGTAPGGGGGRGEADDEEVLAAAVAAAGPLLVMADEGGLDQLRNVAMQFILDHFPAVVATEGYRQLPRPLVDAVAGEAVTRHAELLRQLSSLAAQGQEGSGSLD